ncbi:MAG: MASE1 domain-containing protein [Pseudomonadota bacterium]
MSGHSINHQPAASGWLPVNWHLLLRLVGAAAIEFGLTLYGPAFNVTASGVTPCWPPAGFAIAVLLRCGFSYMPVLAVGSWLAYIVLFRDVGGFANVSLMSAALTAGFMSQAAIAVLATRRIVDIRLVFERANQTIVFFAILIMSTLIGAVNTALVLAIGLQLDWSQFGPNVYAAVVGSMLSIVHFVPFALLWRDGSMQNIIRSRVYEFVALIVVTIIVTIFVFTDLLTVTDHASQLYLVFPVVLWAVFRFYPREMIVVLTFMSSITIYAGLQDTGPFRSGVPSETMLNTLTYIAIGVLVAMTLSTISAQQKRAEFRLRRLNNSLERRVHERTVELAGAIETLHTEIAERHRAERALAESQDRKAAIVDTSLDGIVTIRSDGSIAELNPAAQAIFGYSGRDLPDICFADLIVSRAAVKARQLGIEQYLRNESKSLIGKRVEMYCRRADQTEFPVEISMVPVIDGEVLMYICNVRDITREKNAAQEREMLTQQLVEASHRAGMAEIANGVLHNIGNVLNSVNVSAAIIAEKIRNSRLQGLGDAVDLIRQNESSLGDFFSGDSKGKRLLEYLKVLSIQLNRERDLVLTEFNSVAKNVMHIKEIISRQQSYASETNAPEKANLAELIDEAIKANLSRDEQTIVDTHICSNTELLVDRHNALQIVGNLLQNARDAVSEIPPEAEPKITVATRDTADGVEIVVADNGIGIEPAELRNIFHYAYTTKQHGHGFGLHSSHAAACNMGGDLSGHSDGAGRGARFTLRLPLTRDSDL